MKKKLVSITSVLYFLLLSTTNQACFLQRIDSRKSQEDYKLNLERQVFLKTFAYAYKDIPLEKLGIIALTPFLESAFSREVDDFISKKPGTLFYRLIQSKGKKIIGSVSFDSDQANKTAYTRQFAVLPEFQSKGFAKKLVFALLKAIPLLKLFL